jgi:3-mercaptopyruvate sulfurtransferase SseA
MNYIKNQKNIVTAFLVSVILIAATFFLYSCLQQPEISVMITPETLNKWVTNGYGTDLNGYSKMVIIDATSQNSYTGDGFVPGAYLMDTNVDLNAERSDGVVTIASMVPAKEHIDDLIQRMGIDQETVIVITGDTMLVIGRAYYIFRYWGFPKQQLKVMNGTNATYAEAGFPLETSLPPEPEGSTYTLCNLTQNTSLRTSLSEMISVAEDTDPESVVIDARTSNEYSGVSGAPEAFVGHIKTAVNQNYTELLIDGSSTKPLLPTQDIVSLMDSLGIVESTISYVYCHTGWRASVIFLALDAVLGYSVKLYDGSWAEWGQMADEEKQGALKADSPWRTDLEERSEAISYSIDLGSTVQQITDADSYAPRADLINETDSSVCETGG